MIYSLHVDNPKTTPIPHWESVKWLKGQESINFQPGLNILFGSNGTGKSTVISALATLTHCFQTNWPAVTKQSVNAFLKSNGTLANGLTLEHDGAPVRYLGHKGMDSIPDNVKAVDLSISVKGSHASRPSHQVSAGQDTVSKLIRFLRNDAKSVSYKLKTSQVSDDFRPIWDAAVADIKNADPRPGQPKQQVLLLDEVDLNLDFAHQAAVWSQLRELADGGKHQIIVASHSPFAINVKGANYIETTPGYLEASRAAFRVLMNDASLTPTSVKPKKRLSING